MTYLDNDGRPMGDPVELGKAHAEKLRARLEAAGMDAHAAHAHGVADTLGRASRYRRETNGRGFPDGHRAYGMAAQSWLLAADLGAETPEQGTPEAGTLEVCAAWLLGSDATDWPERFLRALLAGLRGE